MQKTQAGEGVRAEGPPVRVHAVGSHQDLRQVAGRPDLYDDQCVPVLLRAEIQLDKVAGEDILRGGQCACRAWRELCPEQKVFKEWDAGPGRRLSLALR